MQYHFGSKQGLLASIVEFHRTAIDDHRRELLEEREVEGRGEQLSALVEILVAPLAPKLDDPSRQEQLEKILTKLNAISSVKAYRITSQEKS